MESKVKSYDGSGDVKVFLEKVSLHSALKGYEGQKAAQNLASKLEGRAFDVYMRLPPEEREDEQIIKTELLKEFERGNQNREEAIYQLNNTKRKFGESAHTYAYHLMELVKLAYPTFEDDDIETIAKDYYIKGIHPQMQIALKTLPQFAKASISDLASETTRLQLAGIQSFAENKSSQCMSVESPSMIDEIVEKVCAKMSLEAPGAEYGGKADTEQAAFNVGRPNFQRKQRNRNFANQQQRPNTCTMKRACRSCKSTDHLFRSCPKRFCQACGARGHDAWDKSCPNYQ